MKTSFSSEEEMLEFIYMRCTVILALQSLLELNKQTPAAVYFGLDARKWGHSL
jgi:hypothetical protein